MVKGRLVNGASQSHSSQNPLLSHIVIRKFHLQPIIPTILQPARNQGVQRDFGIEVTELCFLSAHAFVKQIVPHSAASKVTNAAHTADGQR